MDLKVDQSHAAGSAMADAALAPPVPPDLLLALPRRPQEQLGCALAIAARAYAELEAGARQLQQEVRHGLQRGRRVWGGNRLPVAANTVTAALTERAPAINASKRHLAQILWLARSTSTQAAHAADEQQRLVAENAQLRATVRGRGLG